MDQVFVRVVARTYDASLTEGSEIVFECATTFPGTGEDQPREWVKDALVGMLEAL